MFAVNSCMMGNFATFLPSGDFSKLTFQNKTKIQEDYQCRTVWTQIRPDILSGLILVQTVRRGNQQMTKVAVAGKELKIKAFWQDRKRKSQFWSDTTRNIIDHPNFRIKTGLDVPWVYKRSIQIKQISLHHKCVFRCFVAAKCCFILKVLFMSVVINATGFS